MILFPQICCLYKVDNLKNCLVGSLQNPGLRNIFALAERKKGQTAGIKSSTDQFNKNTKCECSQLVFILLIFASFQCQHNPKGEGVLIFICTHLLLKSTVICGYQFYNPTYSSRFAKKGKIAGRCQYVTHLTGIELTLLVGGFWMLLEFGGGGDCAHTFQITQKHCEKPNFIMNEEKPRNLIPPEPVFHEEIAIIV